ncbi:MAG: adenylate/guanylate cyclase domain-containing protein [Gammaproteobacteria bacterium]|nr:adenylate/guanylate cyclase domain-containing protein [Gammaproteobacteria bacterium]
MRATPFEDKRLPLQVRNAVAEQERDTERLVCWVQLAVVGMFATLYTLAPKTFSEDSFEPVPVALGGYFGFIVLRLLLVYLERTPRFLLYLSVVADICLLLGLIFSFHLQYQQPASFYLKSPTLLYVFIFIALRALYFQARFLILAGFTAASGWLLLVVYVIKIDPDDAMITRDYVQYLTSNSVLLGAEFDKIITMLIVTAILALAIRRSRRLLIDSTSDRFTARGLARFVPGPIARSVARADDEPRPGAAETREASILFIDIEGFTTLSERLSPDALITLLNAYFAIVSEPIRRHGGVINQFQGDAILATFNLPDALPAHARRAVQAALEIQQTLARHRFVGDVRIKTRVGINTGLVVGGLVGADDLLSYTVHGDAVNLAARLEQLNKHYRTRILISGRTWQLAGPVAAGFTHLQSTPVRGRRNSVEVYGYPPGSPVESVPDPVPAEPVRPRSDVG